MSAHTRTLHLDDYYNNPNRAFVSYINDSKQLETEHSHDYFELFLVSQGSAVHFVNGFSQPLSPATLTFMRPDDTHYYYNFSKDFKIMNILIPPHIIHELFSYLGKGYESDRLLTPTFSPSVQLSNTSYEELMVELEQLVVLEKFIKDKADSFIRYFPMSVNKNKSSAPDWFNWLRLEMLKKENFVEGLPRMHSLSGKTAEHMTRICKKYLKKTPTEFINEIRATYSVYLLVSTDKKIIEICYEVGFNNLSYYYQIFKSIYGMAPLQLRKGKNTELVMGKISETDIFNMFLPASHKAYR
jgi:AraC family cel operon transcriptional repressor